MTCLVYLAFAVFWGVMAYLLPRPPQIVPTVITVAFCLANCISFVRELKQII